MLTLRRLGTEPSYIELNFNEGELKTVTLNLTQEQTDEILKPLGEKGLYNLAKLDIFVCEFLEVISEEKRLIPKMEICKAFLDLCNELTPNVANLIELGFIMGDHSDLEKAFEIIHESVKFVDNLTS